MSANNCSASTISSNPFLNNAYVGIPNVNNFTSLLQSCCQGAPVAQYASNPCMIYCNVTLPTTTQEVADCVAANAEGQKFGTVQSQNVTHSTPTSTGSATASGTASVMQSPSPGATGEGSAGRMEGLSRMGWMVFGLGMLGVFGGLV
ncbi:uncharacterized protein BDR25DRAFT_302395 [Lindgomyces ingoldianus]|uniref:Uncharacterized protein n=1 Tax=Lindgomyces ingoldianus TaxID=673940 RepID=A0ACB6R2U0_9PLEO|nr:uncharacterized protein BDR25DRAFT_302395 [Lindgomyces ingoldianus]KAF2472640.1 hypothetical protein BDR25DRAFT_302395 [Lindgomyces ingoldianus]